MNTPKYCTYYAGEPSNLSTGPATTLTAQIGVSVLTVIYGRPYALSSSLTIDPDGNQVTLEHALRNLDGKFSLVAVGRIKAVLATDALGCGGAYFAAKSGRTIVASHLGPMVSTLDTALELEPVGAAAAMMGSICINRLTPYEGVFRLRSCEYMVIDLESGRIDRIGQYCTVPEIFGVDHEAPGKSVELADLIRAAVTRETGTKALFLSAGKDSQAIALTMPSEWRQHILALSYGGWRSSDRRGGAHVSRKLGMPHKLLGPLRLNLVDYHNPIISIGGGMSGLQVAQHVAGARSGRTRASVAYTGFLGDILTGKPFEPDQSRHEALLVKRNLSRLRTPNINFEAVLSAEIGAIRDALRTELGRYKDLPLGRAPMLVDLTHRQAMWISGTFDMMHQEIEIATPFFNRPLITYLLTRRTIDLNAQRLYKEMLADSGFIDPNGSERWIDLVIRSINKK